MDLGKEVFPLTSKYFEKLGGKFESFIRSFSLKALFSAYNKLNLWFNRLKPISDTTLILNIDRKEFIRLEILCRLNNIRILSATEINLIQ